MTCIFCYNNCNISAERFKPNMLELNMIRIQYYFRLSKEEGWRARSAFKLLQVTYQYLTCLPIWGFYYN